MHQDVGQDLWVRADQAEVVSVHREGDATVVDLELSHTGSGKPITRVDEQTGRQDKLRARPRRYRAGWRLRIPTRPVKTPFITSQCLWVENTDAGPWELVEIFHEPCLTAWVRSDARERGLGDSARSFGELEDLRLHLDLGETIIQ